jgi:hypothetical protein
MRDITGRCNICQKSSVGLEHRCQDSILHQDEIMAALKSIQGSTIFATATKSKKMMSDLNFNPIPSEIKYFIPGKETLRRMVLFLLTLSTVLYLNCSYQTEVCHCLMSMSCQRYHKKSALWL